MNVSSSDGILRFEFDEDLLHTIEDALGSMKSESRRVLKFAVNDTARDAKKDLAKLKEPVDFTSLCKLAVEYSDGVIQQSEHVNQEVLDYARSLG